MPRKGRNIYKRTDNRWEARVYYAGTKKYKSVYGKSYKEAAQKQDVLRISMGTTAKYDFKFNDLADQWFEIKSLSVKKSTAYTYSSKLKKHILPFFSGKSFSKLNTQLLEEFISAKRNEDLSPKYIDDIILIIKSIVNWACERFDYKNNIANFKYAKSVAKEPSILATEDQ